MLCWDNKKFSRTIGPKKNDVEKFSAAIAPDEGSVACASREKSAAPLSVPRRVKSICFNILH